MLASSLDLLVVQASPFCNINCSYCYLTERNSPQRMSAETLRKTFEWVFSSGLAKKRFTCVWHAGEPTAVPIAFYRSAFETIAALKPADLEIDHSFQTNGTLIDQSWCDFIKEHDIKVGVSVDGPAFLHDSRRKTKTGKGTHALVVRGMERLRANGIDFHVITVLTRDSLRHPDELFRFYVEQGIKRVGFNVEEIEGDNAQSSLSLEGVDSLYRTFMRRFLELASAHPGSVVVRELEGALASILGSGRGVSNQQAMPWAIVNVDFAGNFTTFSPELLGAKTKDGDFSLGNVHRDSFAEASESGKFAHMQREIAEGVELCRSCPYFGVCGGGAPANKYFENGSFRSTETLYCRLNRKALVDVVLEAIERLPSAAPSLT
jgi:uncharacterized protein